MIFPAKIEAEMEWISVKDRLPPEQDRVLVCFEDDCIAIERGVYLRLARVSPTGPEKLTELLRLRHCGKMALRRRRQGA